MLFQISIFISQIMNFNVKASVLKTIVDAFKDVVDDCNWECSFHGIRMQAMDSSHICMCTMFLPGSGFTKYECLDSMTIGLKFSVLAKLLKLASNDDDVEMHYKDSRVELAFVNGTKRVELGIVSMLIESDSLRINDIQPGVSITMDSKEFRTIVNDLHMFDDYTVITTSGDKIEFSVSDDVACARVTLKATIDGEYTQKTSYSLKYLSQFSKATSTSQWVELGMSADQPLFVKYDMESFGWIKFYLGPKVEEFV